MNIEKLIAARDWIMKQYGMTEVYTIIEVLDALIDPPEEEE